MILDTGVLISIDRADLPSRQLTVMAARDRDVLRTSEAVVAQVWRDGARQARLARFLRTLEIHPLDDGRNVGHLLRDSGTSDVVGAHVALLAQRTGDAIVTGDVDDLTRLVDAFGHEPPPIVPWPPR